jgi:uncharacterized protein (TIGR02996 family)
MSDGAALLRGILERPADDTARLVYADWLQENGEEVRAEFIRVQCAQDYAPDWHTGDAPAPMTREQKGHVVAFPGFHLVGYDRDDWAVYTHNSNRPTVKRVDVKFARGFVPEIRLPLAEFMEHAPALFRAHPIEKVTLRDRVSLGDGEIDGELDRSWNRDRTRTQSMWPNFLYYLPALIFDRLKGGELMRGADGIEEFRRYPVYQQPAYPDLSQACVAYGRQLAGLSACRVNSDHAAQTE